MIYDIDVYFRLGHVIFYEERNQRVCHETGMVGYYSIETMCHFLGYKKLEYKGVL